MKEAKNLNKNIPTDKKKFLKTQAYNLSNKLKNTLIAKDEKELKNNEHTKTKSVLNSERKQIQDILEDRMLYLKNMAIVWDLEAYTKKEWWKEQLFVKFNWKYGLKLDIYNLNSFLDFCSTHAFIPMIDKIIIDGKDVSEIKKLFWLFNLALFCKDWAIANTLRNEIHKLEESMQPATREILDWIQNISRYINYSYQYLSGKNLDRIKNNGTISENIFAEVAINLENHIRNKVWVVSSYMKLWWYEQDINEKTDLNFVLRKTETQDYLVVPTQLTISANWALKHKEAWVENYILNSICNQKDMPNNFIILSINWDFKKNISNSDDKNNQIIRDYKEWLNNPNEREKSAWWKFPLFIDTLNPKIIKPAEIMYIALHMLYKKFDFKNTNKSSYINACKKIGKLDKTNTSEIHGINLNEIFIETAEVHNIECKDPRWHDILKHKYLVSYQWETMWTIVVYWI